MQHREVDVSLNALFDSISVDPQRPERSISESAPRIVMGADPRRFDNDETTSAVTKSIGSKTRFLAKLVDRDAAAFV